MLIDPSSHRHRGPLKNWALRTISSGLGFAKSKEEMAGSDEEVGRIEGKDDVLSRGCTMMRANAEGVARRLATFSLGSECPSRCPLSNPPVSRAGAGGYNGALSGEDGSTFSLGCGFDPEVNVLAAILSLSRLDVGSSIDTSLSAIKGWWFSFAFWRRLAANAANFDILPSPADEPPRRPERGNKGSTKMSALRDRGTLSQGESWKNDFAVEVAS